MAYIVPSDFSQAALAGSNSGELATLADLKSHLSGCYTVFHSVHWTRAYQGGTCYGEVDFVVVNTSGDALLIEQKNGKLEETGEGLVKSYGQSRKNVGTQIRRSLESIREKFKRQHGDRPRLNLDYLIYCPDHKLISISAPGIDRERIVDADERTRLSSKIEEVLGEGSKEEDEWSRLVEGFFRQSFELVPDIHAHLSAHEKTFTRLCGGLADVVDNIEMHPLRLRVRGTAGCGKSTIAHRLYQRAVASGKRPLLVCYSRPLRERLKAVVGDGGLVQTWNGFCTEFLESRGQQIDFERMASDPAFWDEVAEMVIAERVPPEWMFDTLIVDEGQDFEQGWFEVLNIFLQPESDFVLLEDPDQDLYGREPAALDGMVGYHANTNYRTPASIAHFIRRCLPLEFDTANELPGLGVGVERYEDEEDQPKIVAGIVTSLAKQGFRHEDIVILTCRGVSKSVFSDLDDIGKLPLRRFEGHYDEFGNQVLTDGNLYFESVYRFKGQQAPAVVLVDVDPNPERLERNERVLFCGMTRATVRLDLVVRGSNPYCSRFW